MKSILLQISSLALLVVALVSGVKLRGHVDESEPDLRMFKLKRVRPDDLELIRSGTAPIHNLDTGAILMREFLFSSNQVARCSAYAHLLKLIASHQEASDKRAVDLEVLLSLVIVSDVDVEEYAQLMTRYQLDSIPVRQLFKNAIEALERRRAQTSASMDAWLELMDCAETYQLGLNEFLLKPHRESQAQRYRQFKSLPAELNSSSSSAPVVADQKQENTSKIKSARALIEQLDDEALHKLRASIRSSLSSPASVAVAAAAVDEQEKRATNEQPDEDSKAPDELQLEITIPESAPNSAKSLNAFLIADRISLMSRIKQWLTLVLAARRDQVPLDQRAKLNADSAVAYVECWRDLEQFLANIQSEEEIKTNVLVKKALEYYEDPANKLMAERMHRIVDNYRQVAESMADLEKRKSFSSMDELERAYGRLIELLEATEPVVDLYDVTRVVLSSRAKELHKFRVVNRFIESDLW